MATLLLREKDSEQSFPIIKETVHIGRSRSNEVKIAEPASSRVHCQIKKIGNQYRLIDMGSSNGTHVNGQRVSEKELADGDEISIGKTVIVFLEGESPTSQTSMNSSQPLQDRRVQILLDTILSATSVEDFTSYVTLVLDNIITITRADRAILLRLENDQLKIHTARDRQKKTLTEIVGFSQSIPQKTVETRKAFYHVDSSNDAHDVPTHSMVQFQLRAVMCAPLRVGDRVRGALYVDSSKPQEFTPLDLALFEAVTNHLALAMENVLAAEEKKAREEAERKQLEEENVRLRSSLSQRSHIIGRSAAMQPIYETIQKVAPTDANVILTGESGTGKEVLARAIHDLSPRSAKPLVIVDCASIPETLLESELFGYEKGAFTGAMRQKIGRFESAHGGTIFMDEIAEMPLSLQAKLLRVIQEKEFFRVGGNTSVKVDVRVVAATNKDLKALADRNQFRQDLYFRLNVVSLHIPALRERGEDILLLAEHFLKEIAAEHTAEIAGFTDEARTKMLSHRWPGNVRELKHRIEQAVILTQNDKLTTDDLHLESDWTQGRPLEEARDRFEKDYLMTALKAHRFNVSQTAKVLGISRQHLINLMKKHGITREDQ